MKMHRIFLLLMTVFIFNSPSVEGQIKKKIKNSTIYNPRVSVNQIPTLNMKRDLDIDEEKTYFIQSATGLQNRYLKHKWDISLATDNKVFIQNITGVNRSKWKIKQKDDGYYTIATENGSSVLCLTSSGEVIYCDNRYSQDWNITKDAKGYYNFEIRNTGSYLGLTLNNAQRTENRVQLGNDASATGAKWKLYPTDQPLSFFIDIIPEKIENICLKNLVRGDRDFGGPPTFKLTVQLNINETGIRANVFIDLYEKGGRGTRVQQEISETIYVFRSITPNRQKFGEILTPISQYYEAELEGYGDHDLLAGEHFTAFGPLNRIIIRGDTMGGDISDDYDCNDDTELVLLEFKPILVRHTFTF